LGRGMTCSVISPGLLPGATTSHNSDLGTTIYILEQRRLNYHPVYNFQTKHTHHKSLLQVIHSTDSKLTITHGNMSTNVLGARDTNVQLKPTPSPGKDKPKSLEYHRQVLQSRKDSEPYVSTDDVSTVHETKTHTEPRSMCLLRTRSCLPPHRSWLRSRPSTR
jgi:hypothetical protein